MREQKKKKKLDRQGRCRRGEKLAQEGATADQQYYVNKIMTFICHSPPLTESVKLAMQAQLA